MTTRRGHNTGSISTIRDGQGRVIAYRPQIMLPNGKRTSLPRCKTKSEAQKLLIEKQAEMFAGRVVTGGSQKVRTYLEGWLDTTAHGIRPRTVEVYGLNVRRLAPYIGNYRLDSLRPAHVQDCYNQLLAQGLKPRTVRQAHMVLHKALKDAVRLDIVKTNVTDAVTPPRSPRDEMKTLSFEDASRLFAETAHDRFGPLWVVLATTGVRIGEALGLKWADIDLERGTLHVRRALQRQEKNGLVLVEPKTDKSRRSIEIPSIAVEALRRQRERQMFEQLSAGDRRVDDDLVFSTVYGTPLDRGRVHLNWKDALKRCGPPDIRIHDLRHTAATLMLEQGVALRVAQEMLGHSSIAVTADTYSHVSPQLQRDAANRIDALFEKRQAT